MTPKLVKDIRKRLGLTQSQLARELGVDRAAVNQWEAGTRNPSRIAVKFMELLRELHEKGIEYEQKEKGARDLRKRK